MFQIFFEQSSLRVAIKRLDCETQNSIEISAIEFVHNSAEDASNQLTILSFKEVSTSYASFASVKETDNIGRVTDSSVQKLKSMISLAEIRQLILGKDIDDNNKSFTVLFSTDMNHFRKRIVDLYDKMTLIVALDLSSPSHYLSGEEDGRIKLMNPKSVFGQAVTH